MACKEFGEDQQGSREQWYEQDVEDATAATRIQADIRGCCNIQTGNQVMHVENYPQPNQQHNDTDHAMKHMISKFPTKPWSRILLLGKSAANTRVDTELLSHNSGQ